MAVAMVMIRAEMRKTSLPLRFGAVEGLENTPMTLGYLNLVSYWGTSAEKAINNCET